MSEKCSKIKIDKKCCCFSTNLLIYHKSDKKKTQYRLTSILLNHKHLHLTFLLASFFIAFFNYTSLLVVLVITCHELILKIFSNSFFYQNYMDYGISVLIQPIFLFPLYLYLIQYSFRHDLLICHATLIKHPMQKILL